MFIVTQRRDTELPGIFLTSWRPGLLLIVLIFAVFGVSLTFGLTYSDDDFYVLTNHSFNRDPDNIGNAFIHNYTGTYYRPIVTLSFIWDAILGGTNPLFYHLTNLLIHSLVAILLFQLLVHIGLNRSRALVFSALFAVHPLVTQPVVWIMGRNDTLMAAGVLLSFLYYMRYSREQSASSLFLHLMFFALALLAKEAALFLPVVCVSWYITTRSLPVARSRHLIPSAAGWLFILAGWYAARTNAVPDAFDPNIYGFGALLTNIAAVPEIFFKIIVPMGLSPLSSFSVAWIVGGSVLIIVLLVLFRRRLRERTVLFGIIWFILFLFPSLFVRLKIADAFYDYLECRAYLPMIGVLISMAAGMQLTHRKMSVTITVLGSLLLMLYGVLSVSYSFTYAGRISYFSACTQHAPEKAFVRYQMGRAHRAEGRLEMAMEEIGEAIRLAPHHADFYVDLSEIHFSRGSTQRAVELNRTALRINPRHTLALTNMGAAHESRGEYDSAVICWERAIEIDPDFIPAYESLFSFYFHTGEYESAAAFVGAKDREGRSIPREATLRFAYYFHRARGRDYYAARDYVKAQADFVQAVMLRPMIADSYIDLGAAYFATGNIDSAEIVNTKALEIDDRNANALANLGLIAKSRGEIPQAVDYWTRAALSDSDHISATENLFRHYFERGIMDSARKYAARLQKRGIILTPDIRRALGPTARK